VSRCPVISSAQECWQSLGIVYKLIIYSINKVVKIYVYIPQAVSLHTTVYKYAFPVTVPVYTNYCLKHLQHFGPCNGDGVSLL